MQTLLLHAKMAIGNL